MNTNTVSQTSTPIHDDTAIGGTTRPVAAQAVITRLVRREHRARDYGVGYGSSSGYASGRRYADNWGNVRFQCG